MMLCSQTKVVRADDGSWHMYAASFGHDAGLGSWLSNSRVIHSMSSAPEGTYVPRGMCCVIRMCARQHQVAEVACYRLREDTDGVRQPPF